MCRQFSYYNQLELLLLILVYIHMSCFVYFGENVVPIGHGNSFRLVLESHGKVVENDFPKRVVTLFLIFLPVNKNVFVIFSVIAYYRHLSSQ